MMFQEARKQVNYYDNSYLRKTLVWIKFHKLKKYVKSDVREI